MTIGLFEKENKFDNLRIAVLMLNEFNEMIQ